MLWQPSDQRIKRSKMWAYLNYVHTQHQFLEKLDYEHLHEFSIQQPNAFWKSLFNFFDVTYTGELVPANTDSGFESYGWFQNVKMNFAENLLSQGAEETIAIKALTEAGKKNELTYDELRTEVNNLASYLKEYITPGEVLACYMSNTAETVEAMLATATLGGVFTSTSCDFGVNGVVDRFEQSRPSVLVAATAYEYNGKRISQLEKIHQIVGKVPSIKKVILVDYFENAEHESEGTNFITWDEATKPTTIKVSFEQRRFDEPMYIMYSSGTTGKPKCIVHSIGGTLLQHIKELGLHCDHSKDKNIFFYTTCGWMMWNWLISSLFFGGTITLYEGSPAYPNLERFLSLIEKEQINTFGTSPKFLKVLQDKNLDLSKINFEPLETILSTGSPLLPKQFEFVYRTIKKDVQLSSIAGGTDIIGCFFLGNPILPVEAGVLQCKGLGMDVTCFDENRNEVEEGELVCKQSFPSRPIYFLNDKNNQKINEAYFSKYKNVWYHGDYIRVNERNGAVFLGRSDATLNPGGVRIGTAEIYRQVEQFDYIVDSVCVGETNRRGCGCVAICET